MLNSYTQLSYVRSSSNLEPKDLRLRDPKPKRHRYAQDLDAGFVVAMNEEDALRRKGRYVPAQVPGVRRPARQAPNSVQLKTSRPEYLLHHLQRKSTLSSSHGDGYYRK
jgi:hypothetical protein